MARPPGGQCAADVKFERGTACKTVGCAAFLRTFLHDQDKVKECMHWDQNTYDYYVGVAGIGLAQTRCGDVEAKCRTFADAAADFWGAEAQTCPKDCTMTDSEVKPTMPKCAEGTPLEHGSQCQGKPACATALNALLKEDAVTKVSCFAEVGVSNPYIMDQSMAEVAVAASACGGVDASQLTGCDKWRTTFGNLEVVCPRDCYKSYAEMAADPRKLAGMCADGQEEFGQKCATKECQELLAKFPAGGAEAQSCMASTWQMEPTDLSHAMTGMAVSARGGRDCGAPRLTRLPTPQYLCGGLPEDAAVYIDVFDRFERECREANIPPGTYPSAGYGAKCQASSTCQASLAILAADEVSAHKYSPWNAQPLSSFQALLREIQKSCQPPSGGDLQECDKLVTAFQDVDRLCPVDCVPMEGTRASAEAEASQRGVPVCAEGQFEYGVACKLEKHAACGETIKLVADSGDKAYECMLRTEMGPGLAETGKPGFHAEVNKAKAACVSAAEDKDSGAAAASAASALLGALAALLAVAA